MMLSRVVLPQPDGPSKAYAPPSDHSNVSCFSAQSSGVRGLGRYVWLIFFKVIFAIRAPEVSIRAALILAQFANSRLGVAHDAISLPSVLKYMQWSVLI